MYGFIIFNNELIILKNCIFNILEYSIGNRSAYFISIWICSHIDCLNRIGIMLGNNNTVKAGDLSYRLGIKQNSSGWFQSIEINRIGCIPLGIIKILIELDSSLTFLPFFFFITPFHSKINYYRTNY